MKTKFAILVLTTLISGCGKELVPQPETVPPREDYRLLELAQIDFSKDKVYEAASEDGAIALITKEYLGDAIGKQAILIYTRTADKLWNIDSIAVAAVTMVQKGSSFAPGKEAVSGGSLKYYETDNAYYYNDVAQACQLPRWTVYIKINADGSTSVKTEPVNCYKADIKAVTLPLDGYDYPLVKIAGQLWTAENLKATRYADGSPIPNQGAWTSYSSKFMKSENPDAGLLYNAIALGHDNLSDESKEISSAIAPQGWRLPSGGALGDWAILGNFVPDAEYLLSTSHNATGFSIIPSGRVNTNGELWSPKNDDCLFWSSTNDNASKAYFTKVYYKTAGALIRCTSSTNKRTGMSVRLTKDFNEQIIK